MAHQRLLSMFTKNRPSDGFALPTILIASVVMLAVLLVSVQAVAASRVALNDQYYNQLAREAAESGANMAEECLKRFEREPIWDGKTLTPQTDCYGTVNTSISATLTNTSSLSSSFLVSSPTDRTPTNSKFTSTGTVQLKRANGSVFKTYQYTAHASTGTAMQINGVAFGFGLILGSYFGSIDANGVVRTVGANNFGQLGNGTTDNSATPVTFNIGSRYAKRIYMESAGLGTSTFVVTTADEIWGSGTNAYGQLGNGTAQNRTEAGGNPVRFNLPAGVKPLRVQPAGYNTYVVGDNNRVYAAGSCELGAIGGSTTGCVNKTIECGGSMTLLGQPNPQVVALPTPNPADPNTLPSSVMSSAGSFYYPLSRNCGEKMVGNGNSMFIIMQGGAIYGWGNNSNGQLGLGRTHPQGHQAVVATPTKVGLFGDSGQPKAVDVQTDGSSTTILDSNGDVWSSGNGTGGTMTQDFRIASTPWNNCMVNTNTSGVADGSVTFRACSAATSDYASWNADGNPQSLTDTYRLRNKATDLCLTAPPVGSTANVTASPCDTSDNQKWCANLVDVTGYMLLSSGLYDCNERTMRMSGSGADVKVTSSSPTGVILGDVGLKKLNLPEKITSMSIASHNAAFITYSGKVITRGVNSGGQRGDNSPIQNNLGRYDTSYFNLPLGEKAVDVAITSIGTGGAERFYSNTYATTESGKVYASGTNISGGIGGSLGIGTSGQNTPPFYSGYTSAPQQMLLFGDDIKANTVLAGNGSAIIYSRNQQIYGIGDNRWGNLGTGGIGKVNTPFKNQYITLRPDFILY